MKSRSAVIAFFLASASCVGTEVLIEGPTSTAVVPGTRSGLYRDEGEIYGQMNVQSLAGWQARLTPDPGRGFHIIETTQNTTTLAGSTYWAWLGLNALGGGDYDGPCRSNTAGSLNSAEIHGSMVGTEGHCIVPGYYNYELWHGTQLRESYQLAWLDYDVLDGDVWLNTSDPTGQPGQRAHEPDVVPLYDELSSTVSPPTQQPVLAVGSPQGWASIPLPSGANQSMIVEIAVGDWVRVTAWNVIPTFPHGSQPLLLGVSFAGEPLSYAFPGTPDNKLGRARQYGAAGCLPLTVSIRQARTAAGPELPAFMSSASQWQIMVSVGGGCQGTPQLAGYLNGTAVDNQWTVELSPHADTVPYFLRTQTANYSTGIQWAWTGLNLGTAPYAGHCTSASDVGQNGSEMHPSGGNERHCLLPGRYTYTLRHSGQVADQLVVDWTQFPRQQDGIYVNTAEAGAQNGAEVNTIVTYDPRPSGTITPVLDVKCAEGPNGPWLDACASTDLGNGTTYLGSVGPWVRVGAWNTHDTYNPASGTRAQPLLMRVNFTSSIKTGFAPVVVGGNWYARARELPYGCYIVSVVFHQPGMTDIVAQSGPISIGGACTVTFAQPADTTSPGGGGGGGGGGGEGEGGGEGGGGEGVTCPPTCETIRIQPGQPVTRPIRARNQRPRS